MDSTLQRDAVSCDSSPTVTLRVERISSDAALHALSTAWNDLAGDVPFVRWDWLESWWRHLRSPGDELCVLAVRDSAARLVGVLPAYLQRTVAEGTVVRLLGSGIACSEYMTILCGAADRRAVAAALADWFTGEARREWHLIELEGVARHDLSIRTWLDAMAARDCWLHINAGASCWRIELPNDWDAYLGTLSKSKRQRVRNLYRRQFDSGRATVHTVESASELSAALETFCQLHQRRRTSLGEPGCFAQPAFRDFLDEAGERLYGQGRLQIQTVQLNGRPVSAQWNLVGGPTTYHYQSGIEPDVLDQWPGWLGTIASVRQAIDEGRQSYDFLRGEESYKASWRAEPVDMLQCRIVAPGTLAQWRHRLWLSKRSSKAWLKQILGRTSPVNAHDVPETFLT